MNNLWLDTHNNELEVGEIYQLQHMGVYIFLYLIDFYIQGDSVLIKAISAGVIDGKIHNVSMIDRKFRTQLTPCYSKFFEYRHLIEEFENTDTVSSYTNHKKFKLL